MKTASEIAAMDQATKFEYAKGLFGKVYRGCKYTDIPAIVKHCNGNGKSWGFNSQEHFTQIAKEKNQRLKFVAVQYLLNNYPLHKIEEAIELQVWNKEYRRTRNNVTPKGIKSEIVKVDSDLPKPEAMPEIEAAPKPEPKPEPVIVIDNNVEPDAPALPEYDGLHYMTQKIVALLKAGVSVMMVGPAGSGKTTLGKQCANILGVPFNAMSMSAGASESMFFGRLLPTGDGGKFEHHPSIFMRCYEGPGLNLIDEMDAADANLLIAANTALANGGFYSDLRFGNEYVKRHEQSYILAACNTFGTGADVVYTGREQLDGATLDRFYIVEVGYDPGYEATVRGLDPRMVHKPWKPSRNNDAVVKAALGEWVMQLRSKCAERGLRRIVSTRTLQKALAAYDAGVPVSEIKTDILAGWTRDEKMKVGV